MVIKINLTCTVLHPTRQTGYVVTAAIFRAHFIQNFFLTKKGREAEVEKETQRGGDGEQGSNCKQGKGYQLVTS